MKELTRKKGGAKSEDTAKSPFRTDLMVWMDGELVAWEDATVHVMSHVMHYGSSVFEGVRCYRTAQGPAIFRLQEHVRRLFDSARIYRMQIAFSEEEIARAMRDTVKANRFEACYVRPLVYRGLGTPGVNPLGSPVCCSIVCWDWGAYLGDHSATNGVDVCVSSWWRMGANTIPAMAKASANYMNGQLIKMEAVLNGFSEGVALDPRGYVCEGSGENIFVVRGGIVRTPPLSASVLPGITRDAIITLLREDGIEVREEDIPREALYVADEVFFTGTATEIVTIRSVDRIPVADGNVGPVTRRAQELFHGVVRGDADDRHGWLTRV